jgi:hypothetical protein
MPDRDPRVGDSDLLKRARRLTEDLNLSTLGWRIPSARVIDDFAAGEHDLQAREQELTDVDGSGGGQRTRRAFSLFAPDVDPTSADLVALLLEPDAGGAWRLLVPDSA